MKIGKIKEIKNLNIIIAFVAMLGISLLSFNNSRTLGAKYNKLKSEVNSKTEELARGSAILTTKDNLESEINRLNLELSSLKEKLFSDPEGILFYINRFAEETKISLNSIEPLERIQLEIPKEGKDSKAKPKDKDKEKYIKDISQLPVNLKIKCDYHQLISFLKKIETAPKLILVDEIRIQSNPQDAWNHDIQLALRAPILYATATASK